MVRSDSPISILNLSKMFRPGMMVMGWSESDRAIAINLERETNIAIVGRDTWRNGNLLRAMLYSLAARTSPSKVGLLIADYEIGRGGETGMLDALGYAPHSLLPTANTAEEAVSLMQFLGDLVMDRAERQVTTPAVTAVIANADHLYCKYSDILESLTRILSGGPAVGVHGIITTNPDSPTFQEVTKAGFSLRIEHREIGGDYMDFDYTAVRDNKRMLFRSAFISDFDLYLGMSMSRKKKQRRLPVKSAPVMGGGL